MVSSRFETPKTLIIIKIYELRLPTSEVPWYQDPVFTCCPLSSLGRAAAFSALPEAGHMPDRVSTSAPLPGQGFCPPGNFLGCTLKTHHFLSRFCLFSKFLHEFSFQLQKRILNKTDNSGWWCRYQRRIFRVFPPFLSLAFSYLFLPKQGVGWGLSLKGFTFGII